MLLSSPFSNDGAARGFRQWAGVREKKRLEGTGRGPALGRAPQTEASPGSTPPAYHRMFAAGSVCRVRLLLTQQEHTQVSVTGGQIIFNGCFLGQMHQIPCSTAL